MKDFASFIVERGAATHGEVLAVIDQQLKSRLPFGRLALQMGLLDGAQVFTILAHQTRHAPIRFGEAAVELGVLTPHEVSEVLLEQRKRTTPLEDLLVKAGVLDREAATALREAYEREPRSVRVPRPELRRASADYIVEMAPPSVAVTGASVAIAGAPDHALPPSTTMSLVTRPASVPPPIEKTSPAPSNP